MPPDRAMCGGQTASTRRSALGVPRYLDDVRRASPEGIGGLQGFGLFLEALADPRHGEHDNLMRRHGRPFDPERIDETAIRARMTNLAQRRWKGRSRQKPEQAQLIKPTPMWLSLEGYTMTRGQLTYQTAPQPIAGEL